MADETYSVVAILIFVFVTLNFLFPCNVIFPFDRRTTSILGAVYCYVTRIALFPTRKMDVQDAVNFDVMLLLASIMIINHIVIHLKETKDLITYLQKMVQLSPIEGFWAISFAAFIVSPFLTNDGVCLLFVEPILNAFEFAPLAVDRKDKNDGETYLQKEDAIYFLLALACSANIGSALTYTGNPQNMIISSDAVPVMPSYKFLFFMIVPTLFTWLVTTRWIQRCWMQSREKIIGATQSGYAMTAMIDDSSAISPIHSGELSVKVESEKVPEQELVQVESEAAEPRVSKAGVIMMDAGTCTDNEENLLDLLDTVDHKYIYAKLVAASSGGSSSHAITNLSARRRRALEQSKLQKLDIHSISSPFPYAIPLLILIMIVMIFVGSMPLSGTVCWFAMKMLLTIVLGNYWLDQQCWVKEKPVLRNPDGSEIPALESAEADVDADAGSEVTGNLGGIEAGQDGVVDGGVQTEVLVEDGETELGPMTKEDKIDNLYRFFEALYMSIDYSLLIIFLGLFVVVGNLSSTGIPANIWNKIVGKAPFQTVGSVIGIAAFVLFMSQFIGNVPVIQLAKPNVEPLNDDAKRVAWAVLSFVSTVGGNLTLVGSAANIIVIEKAARLDKTMAIGFFRHFQVCFWVTLLCCTLGALFITGIVMADNAAGSKW